ncbi:MAG: MoaD/ThiS family protein, partial [Acidobacteria bacterium]|nr:MoaD/ThiS family protein [Acidobacteriota bacterium]
MTGEAPAERQANEARIRVRVLFFGAARETVGSDAVQLDLHAPATVATAYTEVLENYPALRTRFGRSLLLALNQEYAPS